MCVCVCVWVWVHANWLKGGVVRGVAHCKRAHNFQVDSQTCTRFSGKSRRTADWANSLGQLAKKGAWQWEWPVTKRCVTS